MDFSLPTEEKAQQKEVREFFEGHSELVSEVREETESGSGYGPKTWKLLCLLGAKGWLTPPWARCVIR